MLWVKLEYPMFQTVISSSSHTHLIIYPFMQECMYALPLLFSFIIFFICTWPQNFLVFNKTIIRPAWWNAFTSFLEFWNILLFSLLIIIVNNILIATTGSNLDFSPKKNQGLVIGSLLRKDLWSHISVQTWQKNKTMSPHCMYLAAIGNRTKIFGRSQNRATKKANYHISCSFSAYFYIL